MKRPKLTAALLALSLAVGAAWAQVRPADEFDKEALEYKNYWLNASEKLEKDNDFKAYLYAIDNFISDHPGCLLARVDMIEILIPLKNDQAQKLANKHFLEANKLLSKIPDSPEGKFSKAKFYRFLSEYYLHLSGDAALSTGFAKLCADNDERLGAQAYYSLAGFCQRKKQFDESFKYYKIAIDCDKELAFLTGNDIRAFSDACLYKKKYADLAAFYDQYIRSQKTCYYPGFGAQAMSAYEMAKRKDKAVLVSVLDKEYALSYAESSADDLISVLNKNYGNDKAAKKCVAFVQKFYDKDAALGKADLDSLPKGVRDFLPVRYMFEMKNSNDIAELKKDFDVFVGTTIGNYYIRLYQKAEAAGDKKTMAEIKEIMKGERYNQDGKNRLNK